MASLINISEVNKLSGDQFEWMFGNVIELCIDAATKVYKKIPFRSVEDICDAFSLYLDGLSTEEKLVILKLHPDLAGRMAAAGELTRESAVEQRSAGLNDITEDQRSIININNERNFLESSHRQLIVDDIINVAVGFLSEHNRFSITNYKYKTKFGFPFIICARENKVQSIIEGLQRRYHSSRDLEITTGINEVKKICKLRVLDIVKNDS